MMQQHPDADPDVQGLRCARLFILKCFFIPDLQLRLVRNGQWHAVTRLITTAKPAIIL